MILLFYKLISFEIRLTKQIKAKWILKVVRTDQGDVTINYDDDDNQIEHILNQKHLQLKSMYVSIDAFWWSKRYVSGSTGAVGDILYLPTQIRKECEIYVRVYENKFCQQ